MGRLGKLAAVSTLINPWLAQGTRNVADILRGQIAGGAAQPVDPATDISQAQTYTPEAAESQQVGRDGAPTAPIDTPSAADELIEEGAEQLESGPQDPQEDAQTTTPQAAEEAVDPQAPQEPVQPAPWQAPEQIIGYDAAPAAGVTHRDRFGNYYRVNEAGQVDRYIKNNPEGERWRRMDNMSRVQPTEAQRRQQMAQGHPEPRDTWTARRQQIGLSALPTDVEGPVYYDAQGMPHQRVDGQMQQLSPHRGWRKRVEQSAYGQRRAANMQDPKWLAAQMRMYTSAGMPVPEKFSQQVARMEQQNPGFRDQVEAHAIVGQAARGGNLKGQSYDQQYQQALKMRQQARKARSAPQTTQGLQSQNPNPRTTISTNRNTQATTTPTYGAKGPQRPQGPKKVTASALQQKLAAVFGLSSASGNRRRALGLRNRRRPPAAKGLTEQQMVRDYQLGQRAMDPGLIGAASRSIGQSTPSMTRPAKRHPGRLGRLMARRGGQSLGRLFLPRSSWNAGRPTKFGL